jgi:hypothetical protein
MTDAKPPDRTGEILAALKRLEDKLTTAIEGNRQQVSVLTQELNMREIRNDLKRMREVWENFLRTPLK